MEFIIKIAQDRVDTAKQILNTLSNMAGAAIPLEELLLREPRIIGLLAEAPTPDQIPAQYIEDLVEDVDDEALDGLSCRKIEGGLEVVGNLSKNCLTEVESVLKRYFHLAATQQLLQDLVAHVPSLLFEFLAGSISDTVARESLGYAIEGIFFQHRFSWPCNSDDQLEKERFFDLYQAEAKRRGLWCDSEADRE